MIIHLKTRSAGLIRTLAISVLAIATGVEIPGNAQSDPAGSPPGEGQAFPAPVNLKALPKTLTGRQVHDIMQQWSAELGVRCNACHVRDLDGVVPAGLAHPRFADDVKPMKGAARIMYTMTEEINRKFITGDDGVSGPVTCGTCHRGKIKPEPFVSSPGGNTSTTQTQPPNVGPLLR